MSRGDTFDDVRGHGRRAEEEAEPRPVAGISGLALPPEGHRPQEPEAREPTFRC